MPAGRIPLEVLKAARSGWTTRREIVELTGVSDRTVWKTAQDLIEDGFLLERDEQRPGKGPRKLYKVAPQWIGGQQ